MSGTPDGSDERAVDRADHHKHMDYVQDVIGRLANNSFVMKGWALTLCAAILGLAASRDQAALAFAALVPAAAFWVLDTYFLRQERAFRAMFRDVAAKRVAQFKMNPRPYAQREPWWPAMFSLSLLGFYGAIVVLTVVVGVLLAAPTVSDSQIPTPDPSFSTTST
ncbi:hypothetical protein [Cellulomonas sp. NPDC058312]|uniref:hypothetical protein n=1 Tax=Cellulomonas sp. NPDC058312 TaxID=3346441 RepID=UPI0036EB0EF3